MAIFARSGGEWVLCSGVLVGPRTVLTAAHCVHGRDDWAIEVYFDSDLLSGGRAISVGSRREHPTQDIAALSLDDNAPIVAEPLPWSGQLLGPRHVQALRLSGYGGPKGDLTRCLRVGERARDLSVDPFRGDATRYTILLDGSAWPGDSGGPLVLEPPGAISPVLVGLHSGVTRGEVANGSLSFVERLVENDPWVLQAAESAPVSASDGF